jgi:hypothetical protein
MRTTLTIEPDVAIELERLRKSREVSLKDIINELLRRGLRDINAQKQRKPFRTRTFKMGPSLIGPLDNIAEVLALVEGEDYK